MTSSRGRKRLNYVKISWGVVNAFLISLVLFLALAVIIYYTRLSEDIIPKSVVVISALSVVMSVIYVIRDVDQYCWLHGGLIGLLYVVILLVLGFFIMPSMPYSSSTILDLVLGFLVGMLAGVLGPNL